MTRLSQDASDPESGEWVSLGDVDPTAGDGTFVVDEAAWEFDEEAERAALAAAAEEFGVELDEDDLAEAGGHAPARGRDHRAAQRRQVHARQPDPRSP